jgi:hypothetical protein
MPEEIAFLGRKTKLEKMRSIFFAGGNHISSAAKTKGFCRLKKSKIF